MKIAGIVFIVVLLFAGCRDHDPPLTIDEQLQGTWQRDWLTMTNRYNFHYGSCDAVACVPGQPVQPYFYAYTTNGDMLTMLDLASGDVSEFTVEFPTDSTAVFWRMDGILYYLKRI